MRIPHQDVSLRQGIFIVASLNLFKYPLVINHGKLKAGKSPNEMEVLEWKPSTGDREGILFCSLNLNFFRLRFYRGFLKMAESPSQHGCFKTQTDEVWMIWG